MTEALAFEGDVLARAHADGEAPWMSSGVTVRVGGKDLIAAVYDTAEDLRKPVQAVVSIGIDRPIIGALDIDRGEGGCGGLCCGYEPEVFRVGSTNVLAVLRNKHDGQNVQLNITLVEAPPAPDPIVVVETAHPVTYDDTRWPVGATLELPTSAAQRLTTEGGITRESAIAAGLKVAPDPGPLHFGLVVASS
jgi:hypothetical protein